MLILGKQVGTTHAPQLMVEVQPVEVTEPSEVKRKVRQPVLELTRPGEVVPENTPIRVDPVLGPSKISNSSNPDSVLKAVKLTETHCPGVLEQMVVVKFSLSP